MLTPFLAAILATQAVAEPAETQSSAAQDAPAEVKSADFQAEALAAGNGDEAIVALERVRARHSDDPAVLINLGVAYAHRGDDAMARNLFKAALQSRTEQSLETADGEVNSRKLARKALSMLERGELRMVKTSVQR